MEMPIDSNLTKFIDIGCGIGHFNIIAYMCYNYSRSIGFDIGGRRNDGKFNLYMRLLRNKFLALLSDNKVRKQNRMLKYVNASSTGNTRLFYNDFFRKLDNVISDNNMKLYYETSVDDVTSNYKLRNDMGIYRYENKYCIDFYCFCFGMKEEHIEQAIIGLVIPFGRQFIFSSTNASSIIDRIKYLLQSHNFNLIRQFTGNMSAAKTNKTRTLYCFRRVLQKI
jgi:hypothetical protein